MNTLFCAALSLVGMCSPVQEAQWDMGTLSVAPGIEELCVDGHPRKRRPDVTYAGLPPKHGYQRDHKIPLCAGGPDTADNVEYEQLEEALAKDHYEWSMCEAMCRGKVSQLRVWQFFDQKEWKRQ
jgi:hypothetical protein